MSTYDKQSKNVEALERLVEIYGANRTRWPARERLRFAGLILDEPEAQRVMAEAAALDQILDLTPVIIENQEHALSSRIIDAAYSKESPSFDADEGGPAAVSNTMKRPAWMRFPQSAGVIGANEWPAAGLLAASLVLGVMLGSAGTLDSTIQAVADVAGLSSNSAVETQLALDEDTVAWAGEELL